MTPQIPAQPREPFPASIPGLRFAAAAPDLWRVASANGAVLGHIERRVAGDEPRYIARRLRAGATKSVPVGEFRTSVDAAEVFR